MRKPVPTPSMTPLVGPVSVNAACARLLVTTTSVLATVSMSTWMSSSIQPRRSDALKLNNW